MPDADYTLYRTIRRQAPMLADFWSDFAHGEAPLPVQLRESLLWSGVSMFDDPRPAARRAQEYGHGKFVAMLYIPKDAPVLVKKTLRDPSHYSVMGTPSDLRALVVQVMPLLDVVGVQ